MMKTLTNIAAILLILSGISIFILGKQVTRLRFERDLYRENTSVLLDTVKQYRTKEGLNAATVRQLELKLSEFRKYRADAATLIGSLRMEIKDLERITTAGTKTEYIVKTIVKDSIVYRDSTVFAPLKCIDYRSRWLDFEGCIDRENHFEGVIRSRDSLLIAEHVTRARFLGFLWKTKRVINRQLEVVSRNPATTIESAEFITIRK